MSRLRGVTVAGIHRTSNTLMSETTEQTIAPSKEETEVGGLSPELASVVAYLAAPITGLIVYVMEEEDRFTRFHAMQSILFGVVSIVIYFAISVIAGITFGIGAVLYLPAVPILGILWLFLMYKAYSGEAWAIPGLGGFIEDQI